MPNSAANASRKLGFSVQLSAHEDYDGGDLEFMNVNTEEDLARARALVASGY